MSEKHTSGAASTTSTSTTSTIKSAFQKLLAKAPSSSPVRDPGTDMAGPGPAEEKTRALEARVAYLAHRS
ncbi:unnamed protein product [Tuber melanosporum]|uniref:(Perigord truffle) hypothetical protein n=1 Tax=Tuber melanosporum (strain Mel28) TaxID=656061 RepID=D5GG11_TUBMM|nr:uncharacterized protein GSTUM_00007147001 [Tuber melanosporum]CAZ83454.1 unnamed protein product [Tuber melanosporum]